MIAAAAITLAGREPVRVARLSAGLGAGAGLLTAAWLACAIASGIAAWLGSRIGSRLEADLKAVFVMVMLAAAAGDLLLRRPGRAPVEPTRSFGAILIVLGLAQLVSATGLVILALAALAPIPEQVAFGGTLGAGAVLSVAWRQSDWEDRVPISALRWVVAGLLLLAAAVTGGG